MDDKTSDLVEWAFKGIITIALGFAITTLKDMSVSVSSLNVKLAAVLERDVSQSRRLDRHEKRLDHHIDKIDELQRDISKAIAPR